MYQRQSRQPHRHIEASIASNHLDNSPKQAALLCDAHDGWLPVRYPIHGMNRSRNSLMWNPSSQQPTSSTRKSTSRASQSPITWPNHASRSGQAGHGKKSIEAKRASMLDEEETMHLEACSSSAFPNKPAYRGHVCEATSNVRLEV